jgi:hypothetical protein
MPLYQSRSHELNDPLPLVVYYSSTSLPSLLVNYRCCQEGLRLLCTGTRSLRKLTAHLLGFDRPRDHMATMAGARRLTASAQNERLLLNFADPAGHLFPRPPPRR